jgi:pimeloyl-ACP methyl ester carboxylesterase
MIKTPLLLLHGAIGSSTQLAALEESLSLHYEVHVPDLPGHGGEALHADFSIPAFAGFVKDYIDTHHLHRPAIFGYSMGGYIACCLGVQHPELISHIITLATKFHWDEPTAIAESKMLQPDILEQKVPRFAETLAQRHAPGDWKAVLAHTAKLMQGLGADPVLKTETYPQLSVPCLLLIGDRDKTASIEETLSVYRALPLAQFSVLPATPHPIEKAPTILLASLIKGFIDTQP